MDSQATVNYKILVSDKLKNELDNFLLGLTVFIFIMTASLYLFQEKYQSYSISSPKKNVTAEKIAKPHTYVVKAGDSLAAVAVAKYGDDKMANEIMKLNSNKITDPNNLEVGQILLLPTIVQSPTPSPTGTNEQHEYQQDNGDISAIQTKQVTLKGGKYTVKDGDGIWQIAEEAYGDGQMWTKIAEANQLQEPYNLQVGKTLVIPR